MVTFFNPHKDVQDLIAEIKKNEENCYEANNLADKKELRLHSVLSQIRDFNESRFFWERKLELEDNE